METLTPIEWRVLEVTAGTPGDLEHLYQRLHVPLADAANAVRSLVTKGILSTRSEVPPPADDVDRLLRSEFEPTTKGREALTAARPGPPPGWPEGRVYPGMFAGMMPDIPFEVFKENRREMSRKYAEEAYE